MTIKQILQIAEKHGKRIVHLSHTHEEITKFEESYNARKTRNKYGKKLPMYDIQVTLFTNNKKSTGGTIAFSDPILVPEVEIVEDTEIDLSEIPF